MTPKSKEAPFASGQSSFAIDARFDPILLGAVNNREFRISDDGWYHIGPIGEFPHTTRISNQDGSKKEIPILQVLDRTAYERIVNRFNEDGEDLLIDYEHFSQDLDKSSVAAGWIQKLQLRNDGLWAQPKFSAKGKADIEGGNYRKISPVFDSWEVVERGEPMRIRPSRMPEAGLTNKPNLKTLNPLSNRATTENQQVNTMDHKTKLIAVLGLEANASDEQIEAASNKRVAETAALQTKVSSLEAEKKTLAGELLNRDLGKYAAVITDDNKEQFKTLLVSNREAAIPVLDSMLAAIPAKDPDAPEKKPGEEFTPVYNKDKAKSPDGSEILDAAEKKQQEEELKATQVRNRAADLRKDNSSLTLAEAYNRATKEVEAETQKKGSK